MTGTVRAMLNKYALGTALALVIAPLAGIESAEAACSPASGQDGVIVTCDSNTSGQDGTTGFGQGTENGVTLTVNSGGSVVGTNIGISLKGNNTITVQSGAAVTASSGDGVDTRDGSTINNAGLIAGISMGIFNSGIGSITLHNSGDVGGFSAVSSIGGMSVDNSGHIVGRTGAGLVSNSGAVNVTLNTGSITGGRFGIEATHATVTNNVNGVIEATSANGVGIGGFNFGPTVVVTLDNAGSVKAIGTAGVAIQAQTVNVNSNTGDITGDENAIFASDTANVTNSKNITANARDGEAIRAQTANVNNLAGGVITGGDNGGRGINATGDLVLNNAGTITADAAVFANDSATITNTGAITGRVGVATGSLTLTNSGAITGTGNEAIDASIDANIANLAGGTIQGATFGVSSGTLTLVNSGMISGTTAIKATGAATITNFGTIQSTAGASGTAIQLSSAADTLNIKRGSTIIGLIDFGHGADVINVDSSAPQTPKGVSMLSRATSVVVDALKQQLVNFDGIINIIGGNSTSGQPSVTVNGTTASLDPTALAQQDRTLMDFSGGMSSMVQGRLGGGVAGGAGPQAMSYAMEDARAEMFAKAPAATWNAPVTVWTSAFGAARNQRGTDTTLDSTSGVFGGVIGIDRRIQPDWLVGVFAGGGSGALNVDLGSQKIDSDYFSGGAYSRFEWASQFFDATLQVGGVNNRSNRLLQNNITGGAEHATASYNGWFISPEIAYGYRINIGNGTVVTPMLRARYVAGFFDGYNETGSAQTLSIGSRTLQDFEERGEVEVAKTGFFGDPSLKGWIRGGVIALQRTGDTNVNAVLIGQNLSFLTPGKGSAVGGVGSVGFDYHVGANVVLFGSVEGNMMSDESRVVTAKGGVRAAF